jgi:hypothetical protein
MDRVLYYIFLEMYYIICCVVEFPANKFMHENNNPKINTYAY